MKAQLKDSLKDAMKAKDRLRMDTIRAALSAIQYEEMRVGREDLSAAEITALLQTEIKKRRESIELVEKGGRLEAVPALREEIAILEGFLPKQLSASELEHIVRGLKAENPTIQLGQIMKHLKEQHSGAYDGKLASEVVKKVLEA